MKIWVWVLCVGSPIVMSADATWQPDRTPDIQYSPSTCATSERYLFINDDEGREVVRISECTGKVTVAHPDKMDEAARQFWLAIEKMFGTPCKKP